MTEPIDDTLSDIYQSDLLDEKKARSQADYEGRVVKKVLTKFGLGDQAKVLAAKVKEATGIGRLTFDWFYEEHPTFPIWLAAKKLPYVFQVKVKDLFNKFASTPMVKAWEEARDESPFADNKLVGVVFDWPGISGTQMVIHNEDALFSGSTRGVFRCAVGPRANCMSLCIQRLDHVLDLISLIWTAGG